MEEKRLMSSSDIKYEIYKEKIFEQFKIDMMNYKNGRHGYWRVTVHSNSKKRAKMVLKTPCINELIECYKKLTEDTEICKICFDFFETSRYELNKKGVFG